MSAGYPGPGEGTPSPQKRTAYDLRDRFAWLNQFSDDELRDVAFCAEEELLRDGEVYFDISRPERGQIVAGRGETVPPGACYVRRGDVSEQTWQKLLNFGRSREMGR